MKHKWTSRKTIVKMKSFTRQNKNLTWKLKKWMTRQRIQRKPTPIQLQSTYNSTPNDGNYCFDGGFRNAIWPVVAFAQAFGLMPVTGISSKTITDLRFKWTSKRAIYGVVVSVITSLYAVLYMWKTLSQRVVFYSIVSVFFFCTSAYGFITFLVIATKWPELMQCWESVELNLTTVNSYKLRKARLRKLRVIAFVFVFFAIVEHSLCIVSVIDKIDSTDGSLIRLLVNNMVPYLNNITDHLPPWAMFPFFFISACATFIWNYLDIFVIMLSVGLSTLFELLNFELEHAKIENLSSQFWSDIRSYNGKLCNLVFMINNTVSHIILVSFSSDLVIICKQLFELLSYNKLSSVHVVYFIYSLIFIIFRTFGLAFLAAQINDESKKPLKLLLSVPSHAWTTETKRFYNEVYRNTIALSGMEFFFLTRKLILSVIGTICTYELVLMQLNRV